MEKEKTGKKTDAGSNMIRTDDTLRETAAHGDSGYPFACYLEDIWDFDFHRIDWHWHHDLEFVYVSSGTAICLIGADRFLLPEGCGLFINSGILHRFQADESTVIPNLVFAPELISPQDSTVYKKYVLPVIRSDCPFLIFQPQIPWQNDILKDLQAIFSLQTEEGCSEEKIKELKTLQFILDLWGILFCRQDSASLSSGVRRLKPQQARLQDMMQFIHDHYREAVSLEAIADSAVISKSSALVIFRTYLNVSPVAYLTGYRLKMAARLLSTTEEPVSVIAEESGFTSAGYFCRKFKQYYRMTPDSYRKQGITRPALIS